MTHPNTQPYTRRGFITLSALALASCGASAGNNGLGGQGAAQIDARVAAARVLAG